MSGSSWNVPVTVFVDDGSSGKALISSDTVKECNLLTSALQSPIPVSLADGSSSTPITHVTEPLKLQIGDHHCEELQFLVGNIQFPILLGLPWTQEHNPSINWKDMIFSFNDPSCFAAGHCKYSSDV